MQGGRLGVLYFLIRRLGFSAALVMIVASGSFTLMHFAPGDAVTDFGPGIHGAQTRAERHALGLDQPFHTLYASWLRRALHLDFGTSLKFRRPVAELLPQRAMNTALLAAAAMLLASLIGLPLGMFTASAHPGPLRTAVNAVSGLLVSIPSLVTTLAVTAGAAMLNLLPPPGAGAGNLAVAAIALALPLIGALEQVQAGAVRAALADPSVLAARARGVPVGRLRWRHAMRLAAGPVVSIYGLVGASLLSGSFVVEAITDWPGLGLLVTDGMRARDLYLVAGCAAAGTTVLTLIVLASDLAQLWLDPRVRDAVRS
jgi:peptide/nickel transport system permease protein